MTEPSPIKSDPMILVASRNRRWASELVTRWTNLERTKPEVWKREISQQRQLKAGIDEIRMYAGERMERVTYMKQPEPFQAEVKEKLKEMEFGK